jgi:hypothetical protein
MRIVILLGTCQNAVAVGSSRRIRMRSPFEV